MNLFLKKKAEDAKSGGRSGHRSCNFFLYVCYFFLDFQSFLNLLICVRIFACFCSFLHVFLRFLHVLCSQFCVLISRVKVALVLFIATLTNCSKGCQSIIKAHDHDSYHMFVIKDEILFLKYIQTKFSLHVLHNLWWH